MPLPTKRNSEAHTARQQWRYILINTPRASFWNDTKVAQRHNKSALPDAQQTSVDNDLKTYRKGATTVLHAQKTRTQSAQNTSCISKARTGKRTAGKEYESQPHYYRKRVSLQSSLTLPCLQKTRQARQKHAAKRTTDKRRKGYENAAKKDKDYTMNAQKKQELKTP